MAKKSNEAYGVVSKGNGEAWLIKEKHMSIVARGGGQAGQGYPCVLAAIEGNGSRPSHKGIGINDGKVMYTLNGTEVHGVVATQRNVNDISKENGNAVSGGASRKL